MNREKRRKKKSSYVKLGLLREKISIEFMQKKKIYIYRQIILRTFLIYSIEIHDFFLLKYASGGSIDEMYTRDESTQS